jgi:membrane peptidoglycan carboxypeptidase
VRRPSVAIKRLHFAEGTPYETVFTRTDSIGVQVLKPEVCAVLKPALLDVVEKGTAVRGKGAFALPDGNWIPLGGKTGTGDQRFETFDKRGNVTDSRVVNRTATFAFFLGERFFGVLTAHVEGEKAARYGFTSSLPVAILKVLTPALMPLVTAPPAEVHAVLYAASQPAEGMADTTLAMAWRP